MKKLMLFTASAALILASCQNLEILETHGDGGAVSTFTAST